MTRGDFATSFGTVQLFDFFFTSGRQVFKGGSRTLPLTRELSGSFPDGIRFEMEENMLSRWLARVGGILLLCLAVGTTASAQYPGGPGGPGGGTMGGTGGSSGSGYSSGNGKAIGIGVGVAAGAAVGVVLLVRHRHHQKESSQALLIGCTKAQPNGISLENEEGGTTYMLAGKPVEPQQRVELRGMVKNDGSRGNTFRVRDVVTNFGACSANHVASTQNPEGNKVAYASK